MQREHLRIQTGRFQRTRGVADFALAGQEHQYVAGMRGEGVFDAAAQMCGQRFVAACGRVRDRDREAAAFGGQARGIEEAREFFAIKRGTHHHDAQVLAHLRLHVECQRQAEIASEVAFVEFVEQDRADAVEHRVVLDHAGQDAFGDDLDTGRGAGAVLETDAVAHRLRHVFAEAARHEAGGGARGDAARFEHHDALSGQPRCVEQGQWHACGLAGAGWGFEHQPRMRGQRFTDRGQQGIDRKGGAHAGARVADQRARAGWWP